MKIIFFYTLLLCNALLYSLSAQNITDKVNKDSIKIGEPLTLTIQVIATADDYPIFQKVDSAIGNFELLDFSKVDLLDKKNQKTTYEKTYTFTSFEEGKQVLPALYVVTNQETLYTNTYPIHVAKVVIDSTAAIKDIKPIEEVESSISDYIVEILLASFVIIGAIAGVYFYKKYQQQWRNARIKDSYTNKLKISKFQQAIDTLHQLEKDKLWTRDQSKLHYTILVDTLKQYLQLTTPVNAMECTTYELSRQLENTSISDVSIHQLKNVLETADLVKFAKQDFPYHQHESILSSGIQFLNTHRYLYDNLNKK